MRGFIIMIRTYCWHGLVVLRRLKEVSGPALYFTTGDVMGIALQINMTEVLSAHVPDVLIFEPLRGRSLYDRRHEIFPENTFAAST